MNLTGLPDHRANANPHGRCIVDDNAIFDNAEFALAVRQAATTLAEAGVRRGDVVAVMLPNTADFVLALFAAWHLGAAVTPINPSLLGEEVAYQVADASARVIVTDRTDVSGNTVDPQTFHQVHRFAADPIDLVPSDLALVIYTSGTTGRPKGVMLDHSNVDAMTSMIIEGLELTAADHSLLILPLFHVNGIMISTLSPLLAGGQTTIAGRFSPKTFFDRLERSGATYFSAVPTIYTMLADLPANVRPDTSKVRFAICGAAPASPELLAKVHDRFGISLLEGYGLSEGSCASTLNPLRGRRKPGTVGTALPGQTVRVVDAEGNDAPVGEVIVRGPNIMRGYLNRPEETSKTLVDGWLHTGDIGRFDADGYLTLVDRAKDMIIRGGENIYPKEIESVVYQLPAVAEAAVVGRPNDLYGEDPVLFVALNTGASITADDVLTHLRGHLTRYKVPVDVTVLDELPKNPVGKFDKPALRKRLLPATA